MAGKWRSAMSYLGLGPDEEYEDEAAPLDNPMSAPMSAPPPPRPSDRVAMRQPSGVGVPQPVESETPSVRTLTPMGADSNDPAARPRTSVVRPLPATGRPHVVAPRSFNDAQGVADTFKKRQPVIINLQGVERELARRIIDFASGVCYGIGGQMERVASQVYLLTPADMEVSDEERRRLRERGLVDS